MRGIDDAIYLSGVVIYQPGDFDHTMQKALACLFYHQQIDIAVTVSFSPGIRAEKNDLFNKRYLKYKEVYTYVKEILYKVAETNLDVCYALKKIKEKLNELSSNQDSDEDLRKFLKTLNLEFVLRYPHRWLCALIF